MMLTTVATEREQASTDLFQQGERFVFESDHVPAAERVDVTQELSSQLFSGFYLTPPTDPGFRTAM